MHDRRASWVARVQDCKDAARDLGDDSIDFESRSHDALGHPRACTALHCRVNSLPSSTGRGCLVSVTAFAVFLHATFACDLLVISHRSFGISRLRRLRPMTLTTCSCDLAISPDRSAHSAKGTREVPIPPPSPSQRSSRHPEIIQYRLANLECPMMTRLMDHRTHFFAFFLPVVKHLPDALLSILF